MKYSLFEQFKSFISTSEGNKNNVRDTKRKLIFYFREVIGFILVSLLWIIPSKKLSILTLCFHNPPQELFEKTVKYLKAKGYEFISLKQFNEMIDNKISEKVALITFDDGWKDNIDLLECIREYNIPVTFFVVASAVDEGNYWWEYVENKRKLKRSKINRELIKFKKMDEERFRNEVANLKSNITLSRSAFTREELIQLSKEPLVTIGSHSFSHPILTNCSYASQKRELSESKNILEKWLKQNVDYFCYPNGDYSEQIKKLAGDNGYKMCFTTVGSYIDINNLDKYAIPRMSLNDNGGYYETVSKIVGIWQIFKRIQSSLKLCITGFSL